MPKLTYPRALLVVVLVAVNVALIAAMVSAGTPLGPYNTGWDGGSEISGTAAAVGVTTTPIVSTSGYERIEPDGTVAFVLGPEQRYSEAAVARLRSFVRNGGRLVVASESNETNALLGELGVRTRINGSLVRDEQFNYRESALPLARNGTNHSLARNLSDVALNHGTFLHPDEAAVVLNTSGVAYVDANENGTLDEFERLGSRTVVTAEPLGAGSVVVVSDASVFTNALLERSGNRQLLRNLVADRTELLVDYSHMEPLPPLAFAFITIRHSPLLQAGIGGVLLGLVAIWYRRPSLRVPAALQRVTGIGTREDEPGEDGHQRVEVDPDALTALLRQEHPEWDDERLDRVTKAIIRQRRQEGADD